MKKIAAIRENIGPQAFIALWVLCVMVLYLYYQDYHFEILRQTWGAVLMYGLVILASFILWRALWIPISRRKPFLRFLGIVGVVFIYELSFLYLSSIRADSIFDLKFFSRWLLLINSQLIVVGAIYLLIYHIGKVLVELFVPELTMRSVYLAVGIMVWLSMLFCLASASVFSSVSILILFGICAFCIDVYSTKIKTFSGRFDYFQPFRIDIENIGFEWFVFCFLFLFNVIALQTDVPIGFDARNYYFNLPRLLSVENGLIAGFQPYNWAFLPAMGYELFDSYSYSAVLLFSFSIFCVLSISDLLASLDWSKKHLGLFACTLLLIPAFDNQWVYDVKIDFVLVFLQIVLLVVFFQNRSKLEPRQAILIGLISGFCLGVKLTHIFWIAGFLVAYVWKQSTTAMALGVLYLIFGIFLVLGVDDISGLGSFHSSAIWQRYIFIILGLLVVGYEWFKGSYKDLFISLALFLSVHIIAFMPWMIKHKSEGSKTFSKELFFGIPYGVQSGGHQMILEYRAWKNGDAHE